jgi:hypothetical protein
LASSGIQAHSSLGQHRPSVGPSAAEMYGVISARG